MQSCFFVVFVVAAAVAASCRAAPNRTPTKVSTTQAAAEVASSGITANNTIHCDIVVAGGSTASLAAALTAATAAPNSSVCLTDPTDWVGGQMTSSAVSAIDFGANSSPIYQSRSFRSLMTALGAPHNPGACWVSKMCYEPINLLERWVNPTLAVLPNLRVFNRTVVTSVEPCDVGSRICALTAVQRTAKGSGGAAGWSKLLSESVEDWYDPVASPDFEKATLRLEGIAFIDATEFGDVLVSGAATALKLPVVQGIEEPTELSSNTDDQCGQAATLTFYMGIRNRSAGTSQPPVPPGSTAKGAHFDIPMNGEGHLPQPWTWDDIWLYRRARLGGSKSGVARCPAHGATGRCAPQLGDLTQQNWGGGNDLDNAYLFAPLHDAVAAANASRYRGGMNLTALSMLEQRAFGWYHYFKNHWAESNSSKLSGAEIFLDRQAVGTNTGLAKMPYLRDTRRSVGIDGFRLAYTEISSPVNFADTVAIGSYAHDTHGLSICKLPAYMHAPPARPYFIPFRALTNAGAENLLVAGKTMATTFSANSATRLHPDEWSSGVAAGAAATLLTRPSASSGSSFLTTRELTAGEGLSQLRNLLNSSAIEQPLGWSHQPVPTPINGVWYGCGISDRCYGLNGAKAPFPVFANDSVCSHKCPHLRADQWLANANYWTPHVNGTLIADHPTALKKSEVESLDLPPAEVKMVSAGFGCQLGTNATHSLHGYYLCSVSNSLKTDDAQQLVPHPRLRLTPAALSAMKTKIVADPLAATIAAQLAEYGATLLDAPVVNCTLAGVEHSLLGQARSVLDRTYTLGLLYRLDGNMSWAQRAVKELLHVTADPACQSWNPAHFLDTAEMMHGVAVGYDWLYDTPALSVNDRTTIANGLASRGLQITAEHWSDWFFTATINWNEVCNGGAIAASLVMLDSPVPAHQALAAAVLKNATANIRLSTSSYGPDGAWSEGSTYWGYATKYALVAIQMLTTATGSDTGLGASPGFHRTSMWRIHNTGPLDDSYNWGDSDADGADEFLVDFFGLASQPVAPLRAVTAYWGRSVFNRTLRCKEAGCALALLDWPSPNLGSVNDLQALPTCKAFRFADSGWDNKTALGYFRSDWRQSKCADWNRAARPGLICEPRRPEDQPVWLAFKGGNGQANHNDLDAGSFVFDMAGHRWAVDLGSDSYGLPNYFDKSASHGKRYSYYRKSSRGHNTLTFNGVDEQPGWCAQDDRAVSSITEFNCSSVAPHALIDLTPAYAKAGGPKPPAPATERVVRGFSIIQNFSRIVVRDEWTAAGADNVTWAMHFLGPSSRKFSTETTVKLSLNKRMATLSSMSGATITASVDDPPSAQFEVVTPVIRTGSINPTGAHPVDNLRKLIVVLDPKRDKGLTVSFSKPGTPPSPPLHSLLDWGTFGVLRYEQHLKTDDLDLDSVSLPWHPSIKCQAEANAFCNNGSLPKLKGESCFHYIRKSARKCEGPMLARKSFAHGHSAEPAWRCYSPGTLTPNHTSYNASNTDQNCYCSLDAEIRAVLAHCGSPDPSPPATPSPPPLPPPPAPGGVAVFSSGTEGYHTFRIPAVVSHPLHHRHLLCFCEGRKYSSADHDWNDIVLKSSDDSGISWSALRLVWGESTSNKHVTIGNPSPIALNTKPGTVILVGCRNNLQVFVMKSQDFGQTWATPQYISSANPSRWPFVATGPPQGIQLPNGRLIVGSDHSTKPGCSGNVSSHVMYSDNDGDLGSWKLSEDYVRSGNECQVAVLPNGTAGHPAGTLIMNSRWRADDFDKAPPGRLTSYSTDSGQSFTVGITAKVGKWTAYAGDSCEGSTITAGPVAAPVLMFSTPYHKFERANMTVFTSKDAGLSWNILQQIDAGPSAYSAMVALNDTHVGLVYESGAYSFLTFRTVSLSPRAHV